MHSSVQHVEQLTGPVAAAPCRPSSCINGGLLDAKEIYFSLNRIHEPLLGPGDDDPFAHSRAFLMQQLQAVEEASSDLPHDVDKLSEWIERGAHDVGARYQEYLQERRAGAPRRYFGSKAHALYFLNAVAPTKLVDGAWLYGVLQRWNDARYANLIRIYLEELGEGLPEKNHVSLYRKLLATHGCEHWPQLGSEYFVQGAIQLALAHHADEFLPEVVGFNLGYEQLPLHLLITSYELNELGIDPYYFTLHVTVDNASTGHARKAMQSVLDAMPVAADREAFLRRMANGYKLNMLGIDTCTAIKSFDLQGEVVRMLAAKAVVGAQVHSDYCRVGGKPVSAWLSQPEQMPDFLAALEQAGWIKRHQDPQDSRFWKLIHGERADMFGVFSAYEQQLMHDWIAGDWSVENGRPRQLSFKARQRLHERIGDGASAPRRAHPARGVIRTHFPHYRAANDQNDFNADLRQLEDRLAALPSREKVMNELIGLMTPAGHHTAAGLMATRIFTRLFEAAA